MRNVSVLTLDVHIREKISRVLELQTFEVQPKTLEFLQNYWLEDIELLERLRMTKQDHFAELHDGIGTCIDISKNPGVKAQSGSLCGVHGICKV